MIKKIGLVMLLSCGTVSFAQAQEIEMGLGVSTFGLTITPEYRINEQFGFRAPFGRFSLSQDIDDVDEVSISGQGTAQIGGAAILADYYPTNLGLRISGGLAIPQYKVEVEGSGSIDVDGNTFNVDSFEGEVSTSGIAPMVGLGYKFSRIAGSNFSGAIDVGAMFVSNYATEYEYSGLTDAAVDDFESEVEQALDDARTELKDNLGVIPFVSLSVTYTF